LVFCLRFRALHRNFLVGPEQQAPLQQRFTREHRSLAEQLADESRTIARQAEGPEGREGITAFLEKRKASYSR